MVTLSATILVRIPLTLTVFSVKFVFEKNEKTKKRNKNDSIKKLISSSEFTNGSVCEIPMLENFFKLSKTWFCSWL